MRLLWLIKILAAVVVASSFDANITITSRRLGEDFIQITVTPYQVAIYSNLNTVLCGGAIVAPQFILTSNACTLEHLAHQLKVRAGSRFWASGGELRNVLRITRHPKFDEKTLDYDFAILKLSAVLTLGTNTINKVALPTDGDVVPELTDFRLSGWGPISQGHGDSCLLSRCLVNNYPRLGCTMFYRDHNITITNQMFCAVIGQSQYFGIEGGDPLVSLRSNKWVASFAVDDRENVHPMIYSRVSVVIPWINGIIN